MTRVPKAQERVQEVIDGHLLDTLFAVVDRKAIESALLDAYRRGVADGAEAARSGRRS